MTKSPIKPPPAPKPKESAFTSIVYDGDGTEAFVRTTQLQVLRTKFGQVINRSEIYQQADAKAQELYAMECEGHA